MRPAVLLFLREPSASPAFRLVFHVRFHATMSTFYDRFRECAERWPHNVALEIQKHDRVESYTYSELRQMAESIGRWLGGQKLAAGARIAILADNHPRWVAAYLGVIAGGNTAVPLDTAFHADQVAKLLKDSGSSLLFCDLKHLAVAAGSGGSISNRNCIAGCRQSGRRRPQCTNRSRPYPGRRFRGF